MATSPFADAIAAALDSVADVAGETVQYWRGTSWVTLTGVPGSTTFETDDAGDSGARVGFVSADWIFQVSKLVFGSTAITPKRGDLIKRTLGSKTLTYEVGFEGIQVFRYCDRNRTRIRVHTKETKSS